eukprot:768086-Hanusia_phi.AAC.5
MLLLLTVSHLGAVQDDLVTAKLLADVLQSRHQLCSYILPPQACIYNHVLDVSCQPPSSQKLVLCQQGSSSYYPALLDVLHHYSEVAPAACSAVSLVTLRNCWQWGGRRHLLRILLKMSFHFSLGISGALVSWARRGRKPFSWSDDSSALITSLSDIFDMESLMLGVSNCRIPPKVTTARLEWGNGQLYGMDDKKIARR